MTFAPGRIPELVGSGAHGRKSDSSRAAFQQGHVQDGIQATRMVLAADRAIRTGEVQEL